MGKRVQEVLVQMVTAGNPVAIKVAVDKFGKHMHSRAEVSIEDDEQGDDLED